MKTLKKEIPAKYGYIITSMRGQGTTRPIGVIDDSGNYELAFCSSCCGVNMAVYPTKQAAEEEILRATKGKNPLVFDGLMVVSLKHTKNQVAAECAIYGSVTYPDGKPEKTDYNTANFCD